MGSFLNLLTAAHYSVNTLLQYVSCSMYGSVFGSSSAVF